MSTVRILAGENALRRLRDEGLKPHMVRIVPGAAGGPKWLILKALDRFLFGSWLADSNQPIDLVGASIGAWRFSAIAGGDPIQMVDAFEEAYLSQRYSDRPDIHEISSEVNRVFKIMVTESLVEHILKNSRFRLHILVDRCRGLTAASAPPLLAAGLGFAALANIVARSSLSFSFERWVFHHPSWLPRFLTERPISAKSATLTHENFQPALEATGAIPLVMHGVKNIPGAKRGTYRDGGIVDYQLDLPYPNQPDDGLILYPHFFSRIVPGWFDKKLTYRKPTAKHLSNVILIAPSDELVSDLPMGKISDRTDFKTFLGKDDDRIIYWRKVLAAGQRMANEIEDLLSKNKISEVAEPLAP